MPKLKEENMHNLFREKNISPLPRKNLTLPKYPLVDEQYHLTPYKFFKEYVGRKPVVIKGLLKNLPALKKWNSEYLKKVGEFTTVRVKKGHPKKKITEAIPFSDYLDYVESNDLSRNPEKLYLHDFRLLKVMENLKEDLIPIPLSYISPWYRPNWWDHVLFFWGKAGSITSMHFDVLGAHNLFFHLKGQKKFIILDKKDVPYCYLYDYNHSTLDPENPDLEEFPLFRHSSPLETTLEAGDVLYMPPHTLHYVRSIDNCISFNIDWHTSKSVLKALLHLGVRRKYNLFYCNVICALGVIFKIPAKILDPLYKKYYEYL